MKRYQLAVMPGDGIGPEVIAESVQTLTTLAQIHGGFHFEIQQFDWGTERYLRTGSLMPDDGLTLLERGGFDGILLGPVGDPRVPDHITLWGLILPIRQAFDQYVNLRPARLLPGVRSPLADKRPQDIDIVCVRENTEGEYAGVGGRVHRGTEQEVAIQSTVFTRQGTERIIRYAFEYARQCKRKKVTNATKSNSMQYNMVFWDEIFHQVAAEYPDIHHEQQLIDSLSARFVSRPESLDVVVASNLFGDILTDLGAAISGSLGLAPSANLNPQRRYPSLFQAIHGSAPDIAGKGIANPIASIWSGQLLLDFLGESEVATLLMRAIEAVLAAGKVHTPDLGGTATSRQLGQAIRDQIQSLAIH
ncbi:MAG TPA: tartrate dehydrogenase [Ktedonobacteraceae bacterium]|nr:tartrate dehydrogenase [Ktedonobacteraceae bacterium]